MMYRFIYQELQLAPWTISGEFIDAHKRAQGTAMMKLTGRSKLLMGNARHSVSLMRCWMPARAVHAGWLNKISQKSLLKRFITGINEFMNCGLTVSCLIMSMLFLRLLRTKRANIIHCRGLCNHLSGILPVERISYWGGKVHFGSRRVTIM